MGAVRLQKFASVDVGARLVDSLEIQAIRKEAHEAGIREGAAAASNAFATEQSRGLTHIQEAIGDTFFAREEAYRLAMTSLQPLIQTMAETLAPALCNKGLSAEIARIAKEASRSAPEDILTISVSPNLVTEISSLLGGNSAIEIRADVDLASSEARVEWGGGFDHIDLGAASKAALNAIDGFFAEVELPAENRIHNAN